MFEFHISREARDRYGVADLLFSFNGNAMFASPAGSRALAHRMNQARAAEPASQVQPAALFAMGLIDEAAHALFAYYRQHVKPTVMTEALAYFREEVGSEPLDRLLAAFVDRFPPTQVYAGEQTAQRWLAGQTEGYPHREAALEELMLLWIENRNPAFAPFRELFDDRPLAQTTVYPALTAALPGFFAAQPELGASRGGIFALLLAVLSGAGSLGDQLALLRGRWSFAMGALEDLLRRLLLAGDVLKEEEVALWLRFNPPGSRGHGGGLEASAQVPDFATAPNEYEAFSPDQEWMPRTVMIAKSTYVWLNQLSRFYGREVLRLDHIPDEELANLAARGMNALWLIGVWERSRASQTIKRLCGNAEAVASAYSLYDYKIAHNLGGEPAYRDLRDRCARHGIRLASDMVPNHMGIDSTWVVEHPEWFLSRRDSPYPAYSFQGPDLSNDDRVEIKIEDHYYQQTDAAVVFQRRDKWTGDTQLIYHGNDGTSFPWNDTAQLNYLSAQVREQVIQTILQVARQFPIIRFDAAMTLAKRHIQRLWFPAPGAGGSIPSRAESAMTTAQFDAAIPEEFWREVVDRVAREVPGTLLLAEAFWLMEGYFVRTLGMHRVYNSAFMVMLRDEDNANYRLVLKNTLEFDPGIMKRYVNFMSNPDERTAIDQFGAGDRFFGVATMMATLPGLPMFGHGQVEGFTEKYGMEYYRPRYDEWADEALVARHNREIAPLLHQRALFAESDNFLLYDCWGDHGGVEENVFAYSNQSGGPDGLRRALVVYNNAYSSTSGTLHQSAAYMDKGSGQLRQRSLSDALALPTGDEDILAYRDNATGLQHLRRARQLHEHGLHIQLRGYGYTVLLDWRELHGEGWVRLCDRLNGAGVEDLDRALLELELKPVHDALAAALDPLLVREFAALAARAPEVAAEDGGLWPHSELMEQWVERAGLFVAKARQEYLARVQPPPALPTPALDGLPQDLLAADAPAVEPVAVAAPVVAHRTVVLSGAALSGAETRATGGAAGRGMPNLPSEAAESAGSASALSDERQSPEAEQQNEAGLTETRLRTRVQALLRLGVVEPQFAHQWPAEALRVVPALASAADSVHVWAPVLAYSLLTAFGESLDLAEPNTPALRVFDEFGLRHVLARAFAFAGAPGEDKWRAAARVRLLLAAGSSAPVLGLPADAWKAGDVRWLAGVNEHGGVTYLNREAHAELVWWYALPALLEASGSVGEQAQVDVVERSILDGLASAERAGYRLMPAEAALDLHGVPEPGGVLKATPASAAASATTAGLSSSVTVVDVAAMPMGKPLTVSELPHKRVPVSAGEEASDAKPEVGASVPPGSVSGKQAQSPAKKSSGTKAPNGAGKTVGSPGKSGDKEQERSGAKATGKKKAKPENPLK